MDSHLGTRGVPTKLNVRQELAFQAFSPAPAFQLSADANADAPSLLTLLLLGPKSSPKPARRDARAVKATLGSHATK